MTAFAVTSVLSLMFYPILLTATQPLRLLSSTAILLVLLFGWLSIWLAVEVVLELRPLTARSR